MIEELFLKHIISFCLRNDIDYDLHDYDLHDAWISSPCFNSTFFIVFKRAGFSAGLYYNETRDPVNRVYFDLSDPTLFKKIEQLILKHWTVTK